MMTDNPSWGYQIEQGATTIWEDWSGNKDVSHPSEPSHNHHFMGAYGEWFHDSLVGLKQAEGIGDEAVAFAHMVVAPQITSDPRLTAASAEYSLPRGKVSVSWHRPHFENRPSGCEFNLTVHVHPNARATLVLPLHCLASSGDDDGIHGPAVVVTEGGIPIWHSSTSAAPHKGYINGMSTELRLGPAPALAVHVGSGRYDLAVAGSE
jgi:hypothetical protein